MCDRKVLPKSARLYHFHSQKMSCNIIINIAILRKYLTSCRLAQRCPRYGIMQEREASLKVRPVRAQGERGSDPR